MPDGSAGSFAVRRASQWFPPCSGASGQTAFAAGPAAPLRILYWRQGVQRERQSIDGRNTAWQLVG